ncbi:MAG: DUF4162 domain-containing protein, partial [Dehalococcoidia bacterium]
AQIRGDTVTLDVNGATGRVSDLLHGVEGVLEVIPDGTAVIARVTHGATAVPALITTLDQAGVSVEAVTLNRPSLNDVYLYHTGHRFTADGDDPAPAPSGPSRGRGRGR